MDNRRIKLAAERILVGLTFDEFLDPEEKETILLVMEEFAEELDASDVVFNLKHI